MEKYLVLYRTPTSVLDDWMKTDPEVQKAEEMKMQADWNAWRERCGSQLKETAGAGKAKRVTSAGTTDARNDVMMYSFVEAESPEAAAKLFEGHPHLQIPQSSIEVMRASSIPGM